MNAAEARKVQIIVRGSSEILIQILEKEIEADDLGRMQRLQKGQEMISQLAAELIEETLEDDEDS